MKTTIDKILLDYLAPEAAHQASARVADAVQQLLASLLAGSEAKATKAAKPAAAVVAEVEKTKAKKGKPKKAKRAKAKTNGGGGGEEAGDDGSSSLTAEGRNIMRFKRKAFWARRRAQMGQEPLPGDAEIIAADDAGRVIDIDRWAKKAGARAGAGMTRKRGGAPRKVVNGKSTVVSAEADF